MGRLRLPNITTSRYCRTCVLRPLTVSTCTPIASCLHVVHDCVALTLPKLRLRWRETLPNWQVICSACQDGIALPSISSFTRLPFGNF